MKTLVFLLEGLSEKYFLERFLPRAFPAINDRGKFAEPVFITFDGKRDLQKQLIRKIRGWGRPESTFFILQDQDKEDCKAAKKRLLSLCGDAGRQNESIVRIACRELENWYLGDLDAVGGVYNSNLERYYNTSRFSKIDELAGTIILQRITNNKYRKIDGGRRIAERINTDYTVNRSDSFKVFCQSVKELVQEHS